MRTPGTYSSYFGQSGFSQQYDAAGDLGYGLAGAALAVNATTPQWNYLKFVFTPNGGFTAIEVFQASSATPDLAYNDPSLTYVSEASWANFNNVQSMDTFTMQTAGEAWGVKDVNIYGTQPALAAAATPTFSPDDHGSATQNAYPISVTISCATAGATIYYTTGGSQPSSSNGTRIASGASVLVSDNTTLKAIAYAAGYAPSATKTASYVGLIFSDNFANFPTPTYSYNGAAWNNPYGWAIQGSMLTSWFTTRTNNPLSVNFGATTPGTPVEVDFQLQVGDQSVSTTLFEFGLTNSVTGPSYAYIENASTYSSYFGQSGFSQQYDAAGDLGYGLVGAAIDINATTPQWNYLKFVFTPNGGFTAVQVFQAGSATPGLAYNDPSLTYQMAANWQNWWNIQSMDTFTMQTAGEAWDVKNVNIYGTEPPPAATPTFSPDGGSFTSARNVVINCATPGATINYTTDGTVPTSSNGTTITAGSSVLINHDLTLKAVAFATGYNQSPVAAASYYFDMFFMDNWSDKTVLGPTLAPAGVDWNVESGLFCADRTVAVNGFSFLQPSANALMFCPVTGNAPPGSRISVDFSPAVVGTPIEAHLKLAQTNNAAASTVFIFGLADTAAGYSFEEDASPDPTN